MKTKAKIAIVLLFPFLSLSFTAIAQEARGRDRTEPMFNASTRLPNGIRVAFAAQTEPPGAMQFESSYVETDGSEGIHRVFIDKKGGLFFGYDVKVEPVASTQQIKVSIMPMSASFEERLRRRSAFRTRGVDVDFQSSSLFQTQAAHVLNDGDILAVDALINQKTGVRIVEIIKASFEEIPLRRGHSTTDSNPARDFTLNDVELKVINYRLLVNDEVVAGFAPTGGCSGSILWFYLPERGRFIFSIKPHEGYDFQKIGKIENNKIYFTEGGEHYQWISSDPILGMGGTFNLWVLRDSQYRPEVDEDVASLTSRASQSDSRKRERARPGLLMGAADRIEFILPKK